MYRIIAGKFMCRCFLNHDKHILSIYTSRKESSSTLMAMVQWPIRTVPAETLGHSGRVYPDGHICLVAQSHCGFFFRRSFSEGVPLDQFLGHLKSWRSIPRMLLAMGEVIQCLDAPLRSQSNLEAEHNVCFGLPQKWFTMVHLTADNV